MAGCEGHANVDVKDNVVTIKVWCTGICEGGACIAKWPSSSSIAGLHFSNGYESEENGIVYKIRQYRIDDVVEKPKIEFSCFCKDLSKGFDVIIERLEPKQGAGDIILKIIEVVVTLGIPLIIKLLLTKKETRGRDVASTLQQMGVEIGNVGGMNSQG